MQPLNQAERRKAFTNFLIFFAVTVVMILITGYYSLQVPFKDNERLREMNRVAENEKSFQDNFQAKLNEALKTLEVVNDEKFAENADGYDSEIQETITKMSALIGKDSVLNKSFYRDILRALTASRLAKKELREIKSKNADAVGWKDKYEVLYRDYKDLENQVLRQQQQPARN